MIDQTALKEDIASRLKPLLSNRDYATATRSYTFPYESYLLQPRIIQSKTGANEIQIDSVLPMLLPENLIQALKSYIESTNDLVYTRHSIPEINRKPGESQTGAIAPSISSQNTIRKVFISGNLPFPVSGSESGWLLDELSFVETEINGRWSYLRLLRSLDSLSQDPEDARYPINVRHLALDFSQRGSKAMDMIEHCLYAICPAWKDNSADFGSALEYLVDWLLWSLGHTHVFPKEENYLQFGIDDPDCDGEAHNRLYQFFSPKLLCLFPYDYLGELYNLLISRSQSAKAKYSSQTHYLSAKAAQEIASDLFKGVQAPESILFIDPEVETGRLLLEASNYTTNLFGISVNTLAARIALINAYFYAPWIIFPPSSIKGLSASLDNTISETTCDLFLRALTLKKLPLNFLQTTSPALGPKLQPIAIRSYRKNPPVAGNPYAPDHSPFLPLENPFAS